MKRDYTRSQFCREIGISLSVLKYSLVKLVKICREKSLSFKTLQSLDIQEIAELMATNPIPLDASLPLPGEGELKGLLSGGERYESLGGISPQVVAYWYASGDHPPIYEIPTGQRVRFVNKEELSEWAATKLGS